MGTEGPTPYTEAMAAPIVFLHGLESAVDARLVPTGSKARYLSERFGAELVPLDTRDAQALARTAPDGLQYPYEGYEDAFRTPMARARAAVGAQTRVIVGSSFGGALALRLVREAPHYRGGLILLAGAGPKLTPYDRLPEDMDVVLVHGTRDDIVPIEHSRRLAASSPRARLIEVDDIHPLPSVVNDEQLGAWVRALLGPAG